MGFKDIFQLYKIGKELGLSREEINGTLLFKNRFPLILALMLIVFIAVFTIFFWNVAILLYAKSTEPVYPRGAAYSSISLKDFRDKR